jgi:hypothetical protein
VLWKSDRNGAVSFGLGFQTGGGRQFSLAGFEFEKNGSPFDLGGETNFLSMMMVESTKA